MFIAQGAQALEPLRALQQQAVVTGDGLEDHPCDLACELVKGRLEGFEVVEG